MYRLSEIPLGLSTFTGSRTFVQDLKDMGQMSLPVRAVRNRAQCAKQKGGCQANAHSWGRVGSRFARQALLKPGSQPEKQDGLKLACHARWPNACCNPAACQAKHLSSSVHLLPTCMAPLVCLCSPICATCTHEQLSLACNSQTDMHSKPVCICQACNSDCASTHCQCMSLPLLSIVRHVCKQSYSCAP